MALHRGIQSALFYYLSCAPWNEANHRKKRRREAARNRAERAAEEADAYRHPSPSDTNPNWAVEIAAGPGPTTRGTKRKVPSGGNGKRGSLEYVERGGASGNGSRVASSTDVARSQGTGGGRAMPGDGGEFRCDSKQGFAQFQRPDEDLSLKDSSSSILQRPEKAKLRDYYASHNPSINDLHPPTVTKVRSREDIAWIFAPVPTADIMSGKAAPRPLSTAISRQTSRASGKQRETPSRSIENTNHRREPSDETIIRHPARTALSRPQLSTILSTSSAPNLESQNVENDDAVSEFVAYSSGDPRVLPWNFTERHSFHSGNEKRGSSPWGGRQEGGITAALVGVPGEDGKEVTEWVYEQTRREWRGERWSMEL